MGNKHAKGGKSSTSAPAQAPVQKQSGNQVVATVQSIKQSVTRLEKRRDHLNKKIALEVTSAKEKAKAKNKKGALLHIKKKKIYEKEVQKLEGQIFTLEQQAITIESGSVNVDVINAMRKGANAQKQINQRIDVDQTADLIDEIKEIQDDANEVSEMLGQTMDDGLDEDELMNELNELGEEETTQVNSGVETSLPQVPTSTVGSNVKLPEAPSHKPTAVKSDEQALAELMGEMTGN
mmetsp:Transcript_3870/g.4460  ORF Transcript_3870/g.4460 Transcript_3870/m.4460 type:complete len:236 (-) Transcript_3870:1007-1714(-)|eukprot:CAMPEP_0184015918 /NCGR_PEP_ID=MMETSP0954-20121128/6626_1 /TAXON_ID=627963 /ORGANISM="Aplanochytrium sp, Strain PBS07" /LENGTH=235 /DNA_ID=CAMNT_0026296853 /DNA_START=172 /DNA_END=879 /DNA_ORIENTATION=-